ncbi:MAG TPA: DNA-processing protein DprA [Flavobacteriales bacterium]
MHEPLLYQIALTFLPGIGPVKAKNLLAYCGSAEAVFNEKASVLQRIPEIGNSTSDTIMGLKNEVLLRAESELDFIIKNNIRPLFYTDKDYPQRLKDCDDGPLMLYAKGNMNLNHPRIISIVGTRNATGYGKGFCEKLIEDLQPYAPLIISGLAYGIDICAHRCAMKCSLPTVGVLAHGLDVLYPNLHLSAAQAMEQNGGLLTEFASRTKMAPELFPMRNRIVAGISDCTIVIESDIKGGSLITAHQASSYGREVFALPGRYSDKLSAGCHNLIRKNIAAIITSAQDLVEYMNWDTERQPKTQQLSLLQSHTEEESRVLKILQDKGKLHVDQLSDYTGFTHSKLSGILLNLEFSGVVKSLPGKIFELE